MTGAVVLAAGASSRMGRPKASLVDRDGRTFLEAIRAVLRASGVDVVRVVVAEGDAAETVVNPDPGRGMLSSVQCGIRALPPDVDALLLWPVDHPLVKTETVKQILAAHRDTETTVVVPVHAGRRGHPVLFANGAIAELLAADATVGARQVVHAHADRLELPVSDPGVVTDIDTPEDYRRIFG